jgi:hypothetical protein
MQPSRTDTRIFSWRRHGVLALALAAGVLLLGAGLAGLPWHAGGTARAAVLADRKPTHSLEWLRIWKIVENLNAKPSRRPMVFLLGGSEARESTVSDRNWAVQVRRLSGLRARTFNFGTSNQTFAQDLALVKKLPGTPSIVLIGVGLGRFTAPGTIPGGQGAVPAARSSARHRVTARRVLTDRQKKTLVRQWMIDRYPFFKKYFDYNANVLGQVIQLCQLRGLHPALLDLPLNLKIIGHAFDRPRAAMRKGCLALAHTYGIRYIDFASRVHLQSRDFLDLVHMVKPGKVIWQLRLSRSVIWLLKHHGMVDT